MIYGHGGIEMKPQGGQPPPTPALSSEPDVVRPSMAPLLEASDTQMMSVCQVPLANGQQFVSCSNSVDPLHQRQQQLVNGNNQQQLTAVSADQMITTNTSLLQQQQQMQEQMHEQLQQLQLQPLSQHLLSGVREQSCAGLSPANLRNQGTEFYAGTNLTGMFIKG